MRIRNLVSLAAIIFFAYSAAFAGENFFETRVSLLPGTINQPLAPLWGSAVEKPVFPLLQNTSVFAPAALDNDKDVPIESVFFNPCCDENVSVSGTAHVLINKNVIHIVVKNISGVGLETGHAYTGRGASVENITFYTKDEGSFGLKLNLTNENGCGFALKLLFHLTLNGNGEATSEVENVNVFCNL